MYDGVHTFHGFVKAILYREIADQDKIESVCCTLPGSSHLLAFSQRPGGGSDSIASAQKLVDNVCPHKPSRAGDENQLSVKDIKLSDELKGVEVIDAYSLVAHDRSLWWRIESF